jgi:hypothetical protein
LVGDGCDITPGTRPSTVVKRLDEYGAFCGGAPAEFTGTPQQSLPNICNATAGADKSCAVLIQAPVSTTDPTPQGGSGAAHWVTVESRNCIKSSAGQWQGTVTVGNWGTVTTMTCQQFMALMTALPARLPQGHFVCFPPATPTGPTTLGL